MTRMQNSTLLNKFIIKPVKEERAHNLPGDAHLLSLLMSLFLCMGLAACNKDSATPESPIARPSITVVPTNTRVIVTQAGFITSPVFVDDIEIRLLGSFPMQVHIQVEGNLATPCSEISHTEQKLGSNNFIMFTIFSKQEADSTCVQVLEPFEESFALDVSGLPAGTYQVSVNGIVGELVLAVDNGTLD